MKLEDYGRRELDELIAKFNEASEAHKLALAQFEQNEKQLNYYANLIKAVTVMVDKRDVTYG